MYYALVLFAVIVSALAPGRRLPFRIPARLERRLSGNAVVPLAVLALVVAQHAFLRLLLDATYHQHPNRSFMAQMPVRFISTFGAGNLDERYLSGFALLALFEAGALLALYCGLARPTRLRLAIVACGASLACIDAAFARAGTSADIYSYVGFSLLGARAYTPPPTSFGGAFSLINVWWRTPMVAAPYGPLWLGIAGHVAGLGHTFFAKIVALRLLGAFALLGTVAALAALNVPPRIVALVALNPALIFEFVANAHNDLFGVMLLLAARAATARGATRAGIVLAVAAGLVKLPFLLFAAFSFAPLTSWLRRVRAFAISLAAALAVSWLAGGRPYLAALYRHTHDSTAGDPVSLLIGASVLVKIAALGAVASSLAGGLFIEGYAWTLPALSALLQPWYLSWTLPYAVGSEKTLRNVAIGLPILMLLADNALGYGTLIDAIAAVAYLWLAVALVRELAARVALRRRPA